MGVGVGVGTLVGVLVGVLAGVGVNAGEDVPQADKNKAKEIIKLKIQNFFILISLVKLEVELTG